MSKIEDCIIVAGDFCAVPKNVAKLALADVKSVFGIPLLELLQKSSGNILNLETPLTDEVSPIVKEGPCLRSPVAVVDSLAKLNLFGVGLANNHILDQGIKGFDDTLEALCAAGIPTVGGGRTLNDSRKSLITEIKGIRIGIYACAEHEFTIAGVDSPGANPFDPFDSINDVRALAKQVNIVVVLYHGLKEYYRYPSPQVMKRCRAFIEAGATFVTCQHSHCIGCMESYMGGRFSTDKGTFAFVEATRIRCVETLYLLQLTYILVRCLSSRCE